MKILMVCLGNICRSPMAQGILEHQAKLLQLDWEIDSAGTSGWHNGEGPDERAIQVCKHHGIDISSQISRKITPADLDHYDLILTMDSSNYQDVLRLCSDELQKSRVSLIMNYKYPDKNMAVPDPYYDNSFEQVYQLLCDTIEKLTEFYIKSGVSLK